MFDAEEPDIYRVWAWFEFQTALLGQARARILHLLLPGSLRGETLPPHEAQFFGYTREEVEQFFDWQRAQLELLAMLQILATTEAIIRLEISMRITKRRKDELSRRLRELGRDGIGKIRLDSVLDAMKDTGCSPKVVGAFRSALNLRHWIAHGRYWVPKLGRRYSPGDILDIASELISALR